jgi:hypothetical protein
VIAVCNLLEKATLTICLVVSKDEGDAVGDKNSNLAIGYRDRTFVTR